jgi:tetratricopeptide (TPR) repeat protein
LHLGPDHADVAEAHEMLASVLVEVNRAPEALDELARAQAIVKAKVGDDHPAYAEILISAARAERARKQPARALEADKRALVILEKAKRGRLIPNVQLAIAKDHLELNQPDLARPYAEQALAALEAIKHGPGIDLARRTLALTQQKK